MPPNFPSQNTFQTRKVVTAFLEHDGKILIVRRSQAVGSHRGRWSGISGYLEHEPLEQALIEIREETGLDEQDVQLVRRGKPLEIDDAEHNTRWHVYPFLFRVGHPDAISLDWENVELRWIAPVDIDNYATVPALGETLARCLNDEAT